MNKVFAVLFFIPLLIKGQCWETVSTGNEHCAALQPNGALWIWGSNGNGQLGDGSNLGKSLPIQVGSDTIWKSF